MRAYKCDACDRMFILPDNDYSDDENVRGPAAELYIYKSRGIASSLDLCQDCLSRVLRTIQIIPVPEGEE